jgi:cytochrome c oxidase subunit 1
MIPRLTGRALWKPGWALWQTRLWFVGMLIMSLSLHYAGLLGAPRRTANVSYVGMPIPNWEPAMMLSAAGGFILFISIMLFVAVAVGTLFANQKTEDMTAEFAEPEPESVPTPAMLQHLWRWGAVALLFALLAYAGPMHEMLTHPAYLAPGMRTW